MSKFKIDSVLRNKEDETGTSYPSFFVKGEYEGKPFEREIALELDGRDGEDIHVSGYDYQKDPEYDYADFADDVCPPVYESEAYKTAYAEYMDAEEVEEV